MKYPPVRPKTKLIDEANFWLTRHTDSLELAKKLLPLWCSDSGGIKYFWDDLAKEIFKIHTFVENLTVNEAKTTESTDNDRDLAHLRYVEACLLSAFQRCKEAANDAEER